MNTAVEKTTCQTSVRVGMADFSVDDENTALLSSRVSAGAVANFCGYVRCKKSPAELHSMQIEHYPGMTERAILGVIQRATTRWNMLGARVIHRTGELVPGERIVYVGVACAHRQSAFDACAFIMDYLKTEAPFWKKEIMLDGSEHWVEAKTSDTAALGRWGQ